MSPLEWLAFGGIPFAGAFALTWIYRRHDRMRCEALERSRREAAERELP